MTRRLSIYVVRSFVLVIALCGVGRSAALAVEVLVNGGLEEGAGPAGWSLTQSITGEPASPVSASEQLDSANYEFNNPAGSLGLGLFLKPYAGNTDPYTDLNKAVNVALSQTVNLSSASGKTFTFSGRTYYQTAYSGNIDTLFADSPSGAIASPTKTFFRVEFLDSASSVLATHTFDLPKNRATEVRPDDYMLNSFTTPAAPAGTAKARVTAAATDMVASCTTACPAGQDVYFDNFSFVQNGLFGGEKLATLSDGTPSGNLNTPGAPAGFTLTSSPAGTDNVQLSTASYAKHSGNVGMWIRAWQGGDTLLQQTVAGNAGAQYTFSGWSKWESGYIGADPGSSTQTFMKVEFLDGASTPNVLSAVNLDLRNVQVNDATWRQMTVPTATAPVGTVSVRISAGATGLGNSGINPQSAMFDDFSLTAVGISVPGDYNGDNKVDASDYVAWRDNPAAHGGTPGGYDTWRANFGTNAGSGSGNLLANSAAVPEPATLCLIVTGLLSIVSIRRRA